MGYTKNYVDKYFQIIENIDFKILDEIIEILFRCWNHGNKFFTLGKIVCFFALMSGYRKCDCRKYFHGD